MLPGDQKALFFEIVASFWEAKSHENHDFFATGETLANHCIRIKSEHLGDAKSNNNQ
jgi:hypothetical protein